MADESVVERVAEPLPEGSPEGRLNSATSAFAQAMLQYICGIAVTGTSTPNGAAGPAAGTQKMGLLTAIPAAGAAGTAANGAYQNITWGAVSGGGGTVATVTGTAVVFTNVPPGTYVGYGVFNTGNVYLYGKGFTSITVPAGATGTITVTPTHTYDVA